MMRIKENYYIKKYYGDFVLLKRAKNKENCKKVLEKVGVYGTLKEVKEAIIKEMIKRETYPAPKVTLNSEVKDFYEFTTDDFKIEDYQAGEQIKDIPIAI
mgnify:FL=1